jgi:hypothetical protein
MRSNLVKGLGTIAKSWVFWLFLITILAVVIRSIPAWTNAAWGNDFGIYYGLTNSLVQKGELFATYTGWGDSYQYFPILYAITGITHWITGIDVITIMPKVAPIFGGLTILILYFIVYELTKRRNLALLSAAFLAVTPVHVYQTSHAAPLTIGHFFMMLSLYFFVKYIQNSKYIIPLIVSTILLVMSHHLTTYFYLISIFVMILFKNLETDLKNLRKEIMYLSACSAITFLYWIFVATPVFYNFMGRWGSITSWHILAFFYLSIFSAFFTIHYVKKYTPRLVSLGRKILLKDVEISHKRALKLFFLSILVLIVGEIFFLFVNFPVSITRMDILTILYSLPFVFFLSFSIMGLEYLRTLENKWFFQGWIVAIFISLTYAVASSRGTLYPDRHIEYMMIPMCIISAFAILKFFKGKIKTFHLPHVSPKLISVKRWLPAIVALAIVCSNGVAVYPVKNSIPEIHDEAISQPCLNAVVWMDENLDKNTSVIATDLKLSKLLWAEGFNTTFECTNETWCTEYWRDCVVDLDYEENHSRVTHIFIDDIMRDKLVGLSLLHNAYMTNESYEKFMYHPFKLIYRNATINNDMEETHWTEIYSINWTYIDEFYLENETYKILDIPI